jgi:hypothetical protein
VPSRDYFKNLTEYEQCLQKFHSVPYDFKSHAEDYCLNDTKVLKSILENLFQAVIANVNQNFLKLLNFCFSISSLSNHLFFKKYNFKKIPTSLKQNVGMYIRRAYFGGRCEVFGNIYEHEHIKYFDFAGMYAQCMLESFHNGSGEFSLTSNTSSPGYHTIKYDSENFNLPVLPSHQENGKLVFMNGKSIGTF